MDENMICDFLRQSIDQLQATTPPVTHQWNTTTIDRKEHGYQIHHSNRPDFPTIIALGHSRKQLSSVENLARALEADARYQRIRCESTERLDGTPLYWLEPNQVVLSILNEYLWQLNHELKYDEQWASQIAKNFLRSLDDGSSVIICYSVVRGLECDFECHTLPGDIQLRSLTDDEVIQFIECNQALLEDQQFPF